MHTVQAFIRGCDKTGLIFKFSARREALAKVEHFKEIALIDLIDCWSSEQTPCTLESFGREIEYEVAAYNVTWNRENGQWVRTNNNADLYEWCEECEAA